MYLKDRDLSNGKHHSPFVQLGPAGYSMRKIKQTGFGFMATTNLTVVVF